MLRSMDKNNNPMVALEKQVDELLKTCERLVHDNTALQKKLKRLNSERDTLLNQKEQAKSHVEAMISRLKSMEDNS